MVPNVMNVDDDFSVIICLLVKNCFTEWLYELIVLMKNKIVFYTYGSFSFFFLPLSHLCQTHPIIMLVFCCSFWEPFFQKWSFGTIKNINALDIKNTINMVLIFFYHLVTTQVKYCLIHISFIIHAGELNLTCIILSVFIKNTIILNIKIQFHALLKMECTELG